MRVRRLNTVDTIVELIVDPKDAILLVVYEGSVGQRYDCFHLISQGRFDKYDKLLLIQNVRSYRYLGNNHIYEEISKQEIGWWKLCEKKVDINDKTKIYYEKESGRVRFEKVGINREENFAKDKILNQNAGNDSNVKKKQVLIVDDSRPIQKILSHLISRSDKLEVCAVASSPSEAMEFIKKNTPDLITLDIHMPEMTGVDFLKKHLQNISSIIVMISSIGLNEGTLVMEALSSGAVSYIPKPSFDEIEKNAAEIILKLEEAAFSTKHMELLKHAARISNTFNHFDGLVAIGSSTGGTQALQLIFESLPKHIPPIIVTQHIPAVFSKALADRLNTLCPFEVKEAEDGELLKQDTIYIAPGGQQFKVVRRGKERRVVITDDPPVNRFRPSVDYLFESVVKLQDQNVVAVILTGMGKDGAKGLLELKKSGATTLAQDEASCIVFGMPKEAINLGAANHIVGLESMASKIVSSYNELKINNSAKKVQSLEKTA